jgi:branched-chain amino acid aminotransferase
MPYYLVNAESKINLLDNFDLTGLDQGTLRLPQGVYTTFRTYDGGKALHLPKHLDRLEESARLAGIPVKLQRQAVRRAIRLSLQMYGGRDCRVRLVVDLVKCIGDVYVLSEPLCLIPEELYSKGVKAIFSSSRRHDPLKKGTDFIPVADQSRSAFPPDVNEALMLGDRDEILEGLSSNFFAVRYGNIYTAGSGILNGITRTMVLDVAQKAQIPVILEGICRSDLEQIQEAFVTSASRGVLPIVAIDEVVIGDGKPGPVTIMLRRLFTERIKAEVKPI